MRILLLAILAIPSLASAQATPDLTMTGSNYTTFVTLPTVPDVWRESPRLRQQKFAAALALKAKAATLLASDGGTFTREHDAYIRRKARSILMMTE